MDKPTTPEPPFGDAQTPLSFSLNQAAALCGVSAYDLWEWTDQGYVRAIGRGDHRRYDRDSLRQILALRDATRSGNRPDARPIAWNGGERITERDQSRRSEEFTVSETPMDDEHLTLQTEMFFALNAEAAASASALAEHFRVPQDQMTRVLDSMVQTRYLSRSRNASEATYRTARSGLHGPSVREQRIRATRRTRVPSRDA